MFKTFLLGLVPGGQVAAIAVSIWQATVAVVKYAVDGVTQCVTHPTTFLVVAAVGFGGAYVQAKWDARLILEARQAAKDLQATYKREDDNDAKMARLAAAAGTKAAAEVLERAKREAEAATPPAPAVAPAAPAAPAAAGLRPISAKRPAATNPGYCGPGMWGGLPTLFGFCG